MRTLRYLGILEKTGLKGIEADDFLETIKSMPECLDVQKCRYLTQKGIASRTQFQTKSELLEWLKNVGRTLFIVEKTKFISDVVKRRKKVKELIMRLGKIKVLFNVDVDKASKITSKFAKYRIYNEVAGYGEYAKTMELDGLRIESKKADGNEYFVITKVK